MSEITVTTVASKADLKRFIALPREIYANDPKWVPPLEMDLKKTLAKSYPFFEHGDGDLFLAIRDGKVVGRISAQVNDAHIAKYHDDVGFFGWFECIDDQAVANALVERVRQWHRDCGRPIKAIRGPLNWDLNGECPGVLIEDHRPGPPCLLMAHSASWYDRLLVNCGFAKEKDLFAWMAVEREGLSEDLDRISKMARKRLGNYSTRRVRFDKGGFKEDMQTVRRLFNSAWANNWGSVDLTQAEIEVIGKGLRPVADARMTRMLEIDGEVVAFIICLPDINPLIKRINGKLLPFGWLTFLCNLKKVRGIRTMLMGVAPNYRTRGLDAIMLEEIIIEGRAIGHRSSELSWVLEDNMPMNLLAKRLATHDRTYRIYQQPLTA